MSIAPEFTVLIPARLQSTRLPNKPLADIHGIPMVVRVAKQAEKSSALKVIVVCDNESIIKACSEFNVEALLTSSKHLSGSDRLAEACTDLGFNDDDLIVNVQGDEPMIDPSLIDNVARTLSERPDCVMSSAAYAIESFEEFVNPNVVKVVLDSKQTALYFSRAAIPYPRDTSQIPWGRSNDALTSPLRHIGIYGYRAAFLRQFPKLAPSEAEQLESLEQLRVLWHGHRIAICITRGTTGFGVDTQEDLERTRILLQPNYAKLSL